MEEQFYLIHLIGMDPWGYLVVGDYTIFNGPVMCASKIKKSDLKLRPIRNYLRRVKYELIDENNSIYGHRNIYVQDHKYKYEYNTYIVNDKNNTYYYLIKIVSKDNDTYLGTHNTRLQNCHLQFANKFKISDLNSYSVKIFLNGFNFELIDAGLIPNQIARFSAYVDKDYRIRYRGSLW